MWRPFASGYLVLTKYLGIYRLIKYSLWNSPFWNEKAGEIDQFKWIIFSGKCTRVQSSWIWRDLAAKHSSADLCSKCGRDLITVFWGDTYYFEFPGRSTLTHKGPIRAKEKKPEKQRRKKKKKKREKDFSSEQCMRSVYNLLVCARSRLPSIFFWSNGCQLCASLLWVQEGEK